MVLERITYFQILGKPLIMYMGILTLTFLLTTVLLGYLLIKGKNIPFKLHKWLGYITAFLALGHGTLGIARFF